MEGELSRTGLQSSSWTAEGHKGVWLDIWNGQNFVTDVCCATAFKEVLVYSHYWDIEFTTRSVAEEILYKQPHLSKTFFLFFFLFPYTNTKMSNVKATPLCSQQ